MGDHRHTLAPFCTLEPAWEQEPGAWGIRVLGWQSVVDPLQSLPLAHSGPATPQGSWGRKGVLITQSSKQPLPACPATEPASGGRQRGRRNPCQSDPSPAGCQPFQAPSPPHSSTSPQMVKGPLLPFQSPGKKAPSWPFMALFSRDGGVTWDQTGYLRTHPFDGMGWVGCCCLCPRLGEGRPRMASTRSQGSLGVGGGCLRGREAPVGRVGFCVCLNLSVCV